MSAQGITEVRKIRVQRDVCRINAGISILTFGFPVFPTSIKIGFLRVKVDVYISNPLQCVKCQRYRHHIMACKRELTCAKCDPTCHWDGDCSQNPHTSLTVTETMDISPGTSPCGKRRDIKTVKVSQGISFPAAKPSAKTVSTMTDATRAQSEVTPTSKSGPQLKKGDNPSPSSVMESHTN